MAFARSKTASSTFCRNENNVTGLCNKQSCPLANSRYATVREINGVCFLYKKVIERAHMPAKLWEKIRLKGSIEQVFEKIQKELEYMPEFYKAKCKDRYRRIQEYLRRTDHLKNDPNQPILTVKKSKVVKREQKRENRAKQVAQVETAIEKELLERLQKGVYGEIYNLPQKTFDTILGKHGKQQEMNDELIDDEVEYVEEESGIEEESEVEEDSGIEEESEVEYLEEFEMSEEEGLQNITVGIQDLEDLQGSTLRKPSRGKKARVEVEYENEGPTKELSK